MKHSYLFAVLIAFSLAACGQKPAETFTPQAPATATSASSPLGLMSKDAGKMAQAVPEPMLTQHAKVLSTINVAPYTYLEVTQDSQTRWLATVAATAATVKKGDTIQFDNGTLMTNFNSKILNRTFPSIALVGRVVIANANAQK